MAFPVAGVRARSQMTSCECGGPGSPYPQLQLLSPEPLRAFEMHLRGEEDQMFGGGEGAVSCHRRCRAFKCQLLTTRLLLSLKAQKIPRCALESTCINYIRYSLS